MDIQKQIDAYISSQPETKRAEMSELHQMIQNISRGCQLWFLDGTDEKGKTVSNPNIGYGFLTMKYTNGKTRDFYQIGLSANTTGISVYILGLDDKKYLAQTYGTKIGKARVSGYCIHFKSLKDLNLDILEDAIRFGFDNSANK